MNLQPRRWYHELTGYHWFVLAVAALGWLFDTMDQQLFVLARVPAMTELLAEGPDKPADQAKISKYGGLATSIFLIGWATGGLGFGVLGDRIGRAKTMMLTILVYSVCTGLSAFSKGFWDFAVYRFLTGLGVGGEFAVGVSLVAEVMPDRARPFALGLLQALSAIGNISAALINNALGAISEEVGIRGAIQIGSLTVTNWRIMFTIGTLPALLAILIRWRLKEPERWQAVAAKGTVERRGSYADLFGDPRWRKRAILGVLLASSGVIGLWAIGFFAPDLNRSVFRKVFEEEARKAGEADLDRDFIRLALQDPQSLSKLPKPVQPGDLLSPSATVKDAQVLFAAVQSLHDQGQTVSSEAVLAALDKDEPLDQVQRGQSPQDRQRRQTYLEGASGGEATVVEHSQRIVKRTTDIAARLTKWAGYTGIMINLGAFFGIYVFSIVTHYVGRKPAFAVSFLLAMLSTAMTFWYLDDLTDVFWMVPIMGFCQLALFGGYAIYFPELFPTRLRSTGVSFCYNVGRFVAAAGPSVLGLLTSEVFANQKEPLRYAGVTMCSVFLVGLLVLPFCPETKGQPLPE